MSKSPLSKDMATPSSPTMPFRSVSFRCSLLTEMLLSEMLLLPRMAQKAKWPFSWYVKSRLPFGLAVIFKTGEMDSSVWVD